RILDVACHSQILVSSQYYDAYIHNKREKDFEFGEPFARTVKHGVRVCIRNCCRGDLGLRKSAETACQGSPVGAVWKSTVESYLHLISGAIDCNNPIAAFAAAKSLIELNDIAAKLLRCLFGMMDPMDRLGFTAMEEAAASTGAGWPSIPTSPEAFFERCQDLH